MFGCFFPDDLVVLLGFGQTLQAFGLGYAKCILVAQSFHEASCLSCTHSHLFLPLEDQLPQRSLVSSSLEGWGPRYLAHLLLSAFPCC